MDSPPSGRIRLQGAISFPVEPKPPAPRAVSRRQILLTQPRPAAMQAANTSCAMRIPRSITKGSRPRLTGGPDLAAIVGVDRAGALSTVRPWRNARPDRGRTWPSDAGRQRQAMPVGTAVERPEHRADQPPPLPSGRRRRCPGWRSPARVGPRHAAAARSRIVTSRIGELAGDGDSRPIARPRQPCSSAAKLRSCHRGESKDLVAVAAEHARCRARRRWRRSSRSPCARAWPAHAPPAARSPRQSRSPAAGRAVGVLCHRARMSGFSTSSNTGGGRPRFLIF